MTLPQPRGEAARPSGPTARAGHGGVEWWVRWPLAPIAIAVPVALMVFYALGALGFYSIPFILRYLPTGIGPAEVSLELTTISFLIGFGLALPLGIIRAYPPRRTHRAPGAPLPPPTSLARKVLTWPLYGFATAYVAVIRGTPFLVQVFIVYYAIIYAYPRLTLFGLTVPFWAGLIALTINTTGYQAEALRGGFQSVDAAQIEAARAVGMTRFQTFRFVTFPQGIRLVTLPLTNEWISNFKTSTIVSYIAVAELFFWSRTYVAYQLSRPGEAFVMIAIFYLVINVSLSRVVSYLEEKRRIPGLGTPVIAARPG
ncbi:MAG: amino acid ABC transporter permease [Thermoplasmata archaeon]|nr:amino acid ABC transporter permease [Thermoplasmata archaeon]